MSWIQHLEELRRRIIVTLAVFVVFLILCLGFVGQIYHFLIGALHGQQLTLLSPADVIQVYLSIAASAAVVLTLPVALWQSWLFVRKGLTEREQRAVVKFFPAVLGVFVLGMCFGYFVVFHLVYNFLLNFAQQNFHTLVTASRYFEFMANIVIPFGFLFEMPVVIMFLVRIGLLTPARLAKYRKYAYLVMVIVASILSPPELVSHLSVAAPLILLYEISVAISKFVYRKRVAAAEIVESIVESEEESRARQKRGDDLK